MRLLEDKKVVKHVKYKNVEVTTPAGVQKPQLSVIFYESPNVNGYPQIQPVKIIFEPAVVTVSSLHLLTTAPGDDTFTGLLTTASVMTPDEFPIERAVKDFVDHLIKFTPITSIEVDKDSIEEVTDLENAQC